MNNMDVLKGDVLTLLGGIKRKMLMLEYLENGMCSSNERFVAFLETHPTPTSVFSLKKQLAEYDEMLLDAITPEKYTSLYYSDMETYTDKFHHRQFLNEIENDVATTYYFNVFIEIMRLGKSENTNFAIEIYDLGDTLYFDNENDMDGFVCHYDCCPYTAFELVHGNLVEMYSE